MNKLAEDLFKKALQLTPEQRSELAAALVASVEEEEDPTSEWEEDLERKGGRSRPSRGRSRPPAGSDGLGRHWR